MKKLAFILLIFVIAGCSNDTATKSSLPKKSANPASPFAADSSAGVVFGIGDVESKFWWSLRLKLDSVSPNILNEEFRTKREFYSKVDITISKPYPEKLHLESNSYHTENFPGQAVLVDLHVFIGDKEIETLTYVTGERARHDKNLFLFDVMEHIDADSTEPILITGLADLYWFKDTDESSIDPDTPRDGINMPKANKMSNIVRIIFN